MKRYDTTPPPPQDNRLPTDYDLAIYARQSTAKQLVENVESTIRQSEGLKQEARRLGWSDSRIVLYVENQIKEGIYGKASGRLRIDDRPHLKALTERILNDEVKAVLVEEVNRLFRDETGIQAAVFANYCKEHHVYVLTADEDSFDFTRRGDLKRFLKEAEYSADYIIKHVKGVMFRSRVNKALRGEYDGRGIPAGYIVPGTGRETKKFIIYEPHARIVRWLFVRYRELGGDFYRLYQEVRSKRVLFPCFPADVETKKVSMSKVTDENGTVIGYTLTEPGLRWLLTNVCYVGTWFVRKHPFIPNNHPAIIDEETFWYAYNKINHVNEAGEPVRMTRNRNPEKQTLLSKIITASSASNPSAQVYVIQYNGKSIYKIIDGTAQIRGDYQGLGSIYTEQLDRVFEEHFLTVLESIIGSTTKGIPGLTPKIQEIMQKLTTPEQESTKVLDDQIARYRTEAASLDNTLQYGSAALSPQKILKYSERLTLVETELLQLKKKRAHIVGSYEKRLEAARLLVSAADQWNSWTLDTKRHFIQLMTSSITLTKPAQNWLLLTITWEWFDRDRDFCFVRQLQGQGSVWTPEENERLTTLYPTSERQTILEALPHRNWNAITTQAQGLHLKRERRLNYSELGRYTSVSDQAFMQRYGLESKDVQWLDISTFVQRYGLEDGERYWLSYIDLMKRLSQRPFVYSADFMQRSYCW